jgi:hypothetical protein
VRSRSGATVVCPSCGTPVPGAGTNGGLKALIVALIVAVLAAVVVIVVLAVGVGKATTSIAKAVTPKPGRPSGYDGPAYPGMLVQDQVAAGAGASIDLYGETIGAGDLTRTPTLLGPTLCSSVTIADDSATTVNVGPTEWRLQGPDGVVDTFAINGTLQGGQIAPGGKAAGSVCFPDHGQSGTFVLLWQPLLRIGRGVWLFHL